MKAFVFSSARSDRDPKKAGSGRRSVAAMFPHVLAYTLELSFFAQRSRFDSKQNDAFRVSKSAPGGLRKSEMAPYENSQEWYSDIGRELCRTLVSWKSSP